MFWRTSSVVPNKFFPRNGPSCQGYSGRTCGVFGHPHLDLFSTRTSFIHLAGSQIWWRGSRTRFQHPWDHLSANAFPPFAVLWQILSKVHRSMGLSLVLVAPLWPENEWFTSLLSLLVNLLVQPHVWKFPSRPRGPPPMRVEVIQCFIRKTGFSRADARVAAVDLRRSTAALYQSRFLGWCNRRHVSPC